MIKKCNFMKKITMKFLVPLAFVAVLYGVACTSKTSSEKNAQTSGVDSSYQTRMEREDSRNGTDKRYNGERKDRRNADGASENDETETKPKSGRVKPEYRYLFGKWKGNLRNKKLIVVIDFINGNEVEGYSIAGDNERPFKGRITEDDRGGDGECGGEQIAYKLILLEPGNDKWDGKFTLYLSDCPDYGMDPETLYPGDKIIGHDYSGMGSWVAYSGALRGDIYLTK